MADGRPMDRVRKDEDEQEDDEGKCRHGLVPCDVFGSFLGVKQL